MFFNTALGKNMFSNTTLGKHMFSIQAPGVFAGEVNESQVSGSFEQEINSDDILD